MKRLATIVIGAGLGVAVACGPAAPPPAATASPGRPSILLLTLDTTRADAIGPDASGITTPAFDALAARGLRFRQAYATVPETLPSHASMMTGLYPAGHGLHENGRVLADRQPVVAELVRKAGYRTAAFVSSFSLARRFGLARGFDRYDDAFPEGQAERSARATTGAVVADLPAEPRQQLFLWVHYNDPHAPYDPPEPYRTRFAGRPYLGEVAAMDEQIGRVVQAFEQHVSGPTAVIVVADHGEGLGDHGEAQHGHLLYQSTMHVPLVVVGPGVSPGVSATPVSTRHVFNTILDWAGIDAARSLRTADPDGGLVLGEAMKPFLEYGWQPQAMVVSGRLKAILAGRQEEIYDLAADPAEAHDLAATASLPAAAHDALWDYPAPAPEAAPTPATLDEEARRKLASLGYVSAGTAPVIRKDAPRPVDMAGLFDLLDRASGLFVTAQYAKVIPVLDEILARDPHNLDAMLRLATACSALGHDAQALAAFARAQAAAPQSADVRLYLALHYARGAGWAKAVPLLERVVADEPDRLPALEALAALRERQGRLADAVALRQRVYQLRTPSAAELVGLGALAMGAGQTPVALSAFEEARRVQGASFTHDLELGVLYLAARRLEDARTALDRVPATSRDYPMALFKRAQVSVLLEEPDAASRIDLARRHADAVTRPLIEREALFRNRGDGGRVRPPSR